MTITRKSLEEREKKENLSCQFLKHILQATRIQEHATKGS